MMIKTFDAWNLLFHSNPLFPSLLLLLLLLICKSTVLDPRPRDMPSSDDIQNCATKLID